MFSIISCLLFATLVSSVAFNVSLEIEGSCSPIFTLVCRHNDTNVDPLWVHNNTDVDGDGASIRKLFNTNYTKHSLTEHRLTVDNSTMNYDGYHIQCLFHRASKLFKSNAVNYFYAPTGYQPSLNLINTGIDYPNGNATVVYTVENCRPQCVNVSTRIKPADNVIISEEGAGCNRTVRLSQLQQCQNYRLDILSENNTALLSHNLTPPPGEFIIDHCQDLTIAGQLNLFQVGLRNLEPDCPDFAGETYRVEVDGKPVASLSARSLGPSLNGFFQLTINPPYSLPENASILTVTRLNGKSGTGQVDTFSFPCNCLGDSKVASSGGSHVAYSLLSLLSLVLFVPGSG